jgi:FkbM family methyltransferase
MENNFSILKQILQSLYHDLDLVNWIVELGSRDCNETILFEENYTKAKILTLECNPVMLPICRERIKGKEHITLIEKAISDINGRVKFYPIDPKKTKTTWSDGNPGASSLYKASGKYPVEKYAQTEVEVDSIRLDQILSEYKINIVDLIWMDLQGAELMALKGLGNRIEDVKIVHTEAEFMEIYTGQPLFADIESFMLANNFAFTGFTSKSEFACDVIFLNKRFFSDKEVLQVSNILKKEQKGFVTLKDRLLNFLKKSVKK